MDVKPRWTPEMQRAADDIRDAAQRAANAYDLSWNELLVAMAMAAATFVRVMVWQWAVEGYGVEDIEVKLQNIGIKVDRDQIKERVWRAHGKELNQGKDKA